MVRKSLPRSGDRPRYAGKFSISRSFEGIHSADYEENRHRSGSKLKHHFDHGDGRRGIYRFSRIRGIVSKVFGLICDRVFCTGFKLFLRMKVFCLRQKTFPLGLCCPAGVALPRSSWKSLESYLIKKSCIASHF